MNSQKDTRMFYKLISSQRKAAKKQLHTLVVDKKECKTLEEIREGWVEHFKK